MSTRTPILQFLDNCSYIVTTYGRAPVVRNGRKRTQPSFQKHERSLAGYAEPARYSPDLYAPRKEAYKMLKAAVVGGPSLVFCRKHEAGKTRICSHKFQDAKMCRKAVRCTQAQCWVTCPVATRSLCIQVTNARERGKVLQPSAARQMLWFYRGGHRGAQKVVGEV